MRKLPLFLWAASMTLAVWTACGGQTTTTGDGGSDAAPDVTPDVIGDQKSNDVVIPDASPPPPPTDAGGQPPPPPDGGTPTTNIYTFAISTLFLGEADRNGDPPSTTAWKAYGYDVDGLVTDKNSVNVCTLSAGAPKTNQTDGLNGIDNAWGETILPIVQTASSSPTPSITETAFIDTGNFTLQIQVVGLSDDPQQNAVGLKSQLFVSGAYGNGTPAFDTSTNWPVLSTSVNDGATIASGAKVAFASSYVSNGTYVSGASGSPIVLSLSFGGVLMPLTIHDAVITFDHTAHADASFGTISGVINTQEFVTALQAVAGSISVSLCGSAFDGIAQQIDQAQDILADGTNTANVACDGISIGIGFTAKLVQNPTVVNQAPSPPPDPCGD